jgi:hypothetical protein
MEIFLLINQTYFELVRKNINHGVTKKEADIKKCLDCNITGKFHLF